jgi:hypothetical protein
MCAVKDDQSVVDREADQDKTHEPPRPTHPLPLCGWSPRKEDRWSCNCAPMNGIRSTRAGFARGAFTNGLRRSAHRAEEGSLLRTLRAVVE